MGCYLCNIFHCFYTEKALSKDNYDSWVEAKFGVQCERIHDSVPNLVHYMKMALNQEVLFLFLRNVLIDE